MSTNAKKRKSLRERRKIQRRKLQIRAAAALLSLVAVTFLLIFHFTPQNTQADSEPKAPTYKYYTSIRVSVGHRQRIPYRRILRYFQLHC